MIIFLHLCVETIGFCIIQNCFMELLIRRLLIRMARRISGKGELMIVIEDSDGNIFGGFMTQSFAIRDSFFGTGDSFIFKVLVI